MRIIHILNEGYTDESESVENNHEEQPEFTYQNTTIGPLETNHAAIASAVPGTVLQQVL